MKSLFLPILFALGTAICWGLYGPVLQNARSSENAWSPFKPYVFIGVAYVVCAIFGGGMGMKARGDSFNFFGSQSPAMIWGFLAGTLGALGALSLTNAMLSGGKPLFVMPIVFGGAVSITAIVSTVRIRQSVSPVLWVGMTLVVVGIVLVAMYTPHGHGRKKVEEAPLSAAPADPDPATNSEPTADGHTEST